MPSLRPGHLSRILLVAGGLTVLGAVHVAYTQLDTLQESSGQLARTIWSHAPLRPPYPFADAPGAELLEVEVGSGASSSSSSSSLADAPSSAVDSPEVSASTQNWLATGPEITPSDSTSAAPVASEKAVDAPAPREPCARTLLYTFSGRHGLGSELLMLVRVALLADRYDYTLVLDSSDWNYGQWSDYFEHPEIDCVPPSPRIARSRMRLEDGVASDSPPSWARKPHVYWHRDVSHLDEVITTLFVDAGESEQERHDPALVGSTDEHADLIPASSTVPPAFHNIYALMSDALRRLWRPHSALRDDIAALKRDLGLSVDADSIALHVRLGDKHLELHNIGDGHKSGGKHDAPTLSSALLHKYVAAAHQLSQPDTPSPTLIVMSDDPNALSYFRVIEESEGIKVISTADLPSVGGSGESAHPFSKSNGFNENRFNALPLAERVAVTHDFVRDLTVLAHGVDGIVMTASSNVGRLLCLLAGKEMVLERQAVMTADVHWFPTAHWM